MNDFGTALRDSLHLTSLENTVNIQAKIAEAHKHLACASALLAGGDSIGAVSAGAEAIHAGAEVAEIRALIAAETLLRREREDASDREFGITPPTRNVPPLPGESRAQQATRAEAAKQGKQLGVLLDVVNGGTR
jgi:hypothetical protein